MGKVFILMCLVCLVGCGVYNSRNLIRVQGEDMDFSYGLISCRNVSEVMLLRETNAGKGKSEYSIPNLSQYDCNEPDSQTLAEVCAEVAKDVEPSE